MASARRVVPASGRGDVLQMKTKILKITVAILLAVAAFTASAQNDTNRFRALVLAERGDQHEAFVVAALQWLKTTAAQDHFAIDVFENPNQFTKAFLSRYQVIIQLNYPPYRWSDEAKAAFQDYIEQRRGGWVGMHHATLLGEFDGYAMWPWFSDFMGGIRFKNYIARRVTGTVVVEDAAHPALKGVPATFPVAEEEWYTYDKDPRPNVHVLAHVDESSYQPASDIKMGDHPVIWTNEKMKARNIYIQMGHHPSLFTNEVYKTLLRNSILWAAGAETSSAQTPAPSFKVVAFYTGKNDLAHISFVHEANRWFPQMAVKYNFAYDSTTNWNQLNAAFLSRYQVVVFLDTRPEGAAQRKAFENYMEHGGAWMGFHFAAFALNPSDVPQNWDWYHEMFLGSGEYLSNTWRPTSAVLRVEDPNHPATQNLPATFNSAPNEWYRWQNNLRTNADIKVLLSIDPASFPLGTGPKPNEIWHQGDYPVVWTNQKYKMIYFNMGHNDMDYEHKTNKELSFTLANETQDKLIVDSLLWLGGGRKQ
jgi:type 1 glutamine amidotransferase